MKSINITGYVGIRPVFREFTNYIVDYIQELGYEYIITNKIYDDRLNIVVGAVHHCEYYLNMKMPPDTIIVNLEQLYDDCKWIQEPYFELLSKYRVLDYSSHNVKWLAERYDIKADLLQRLYCKRFETVVHLSEDQKDIDVLFLGALTPERLAIKTALQQQPEIKNVIFKEGVWNDERDKLIARSKIVLNIHCYPIKVFESSRVGFLLSNQVFVISETSIDDQDYSELDEGIVRVDRSELVDTVIKYLNNLTERQKIAQLGYQKVKNFTNKNPSFKI